VERHLDGLEVVVETHFGCEQRQLVAVLDALDDPGLHRGDLFGPIA
jgi:hypothetical protein